PADSVNQWKTIDASSYQPPTARAVHLNGYYDNYGSSGIAFYFSTKAGSGGTYFCADWGDGTGICDTTVLTNNRSFAYYAQITRGSNDGAQCTNFMYRGYEEDLGEY